MKLNSFFSKFILACVSFGVFLFWPISQIQAQACEDIQCSKDADNYLDCNKSKQSCWEGKISETKQKANTLTNAINVLNGQISLQQLQIDQTLAEIAKLEEEIAELTERIGGLIVSLDRLGTALIERVRVEYKHSRSTPSLQLLGANSFSELVNQMKYLLLAQRQTAEAMERTETQRLEYDEQKNLKETKQTELEGKRRTLQGQQAVLEQQKKDQQFLLTQTKSDEAKYQAELAKTLAEAAAIQSIIASKGSETEVKQVNQGDAIASIIVGASACSTGTHLHFEVAKDGSRRDPAGYLKGVDILWSNNPDGTFGLLGGWEWPVNNPARITQGYGMTHYARLGYYGGAPHTGIDMVSKSAGDYTVKAVKKGTLYRGSISCGGGLLRYVKVDHEGESEDTYYLHINY